ncbi:uncharacterized protein BX663DRAFT_535907 [Cokeromyces recurvatus]|uniref:uncharacterized protein n=1 Tax=Cokeromyces recurvatus TaxID=90255 RepID=UPI0022200BB8|nr:uncharacterized protein BX663DRAFT_535907 [Cokeromyces recurvatus]KAI7903861.1 hypothetical protein BX663DRAFT_535907 [Cokeromyces recurvatus]
MGQNLVLNMSDHDFTVCTQIISAHYIEKLYLKLKRPRKIMLLIEAGTVVNSYIELLLPYLDQDDDNSYFLDSIRRDKDVRYECYCICCEKVLSLMPGDGHSKIWSIIQPIFQAIAAKASDVSPCCDGIINKSRSGHYVKMVHNSIE